MANQGSPTIVLSTMTLANTEYNTAIPKETYKWSLKCQDGTELFYAYATGVVANHNSGNYKTLWQNGVKYEDGGNPAGFTLYYACATAGKVAEIEYWV